NAGILLHPCLTLRRLGHYGFASIWKVRRASTMAAKQLAIKGKALIDGNGGPVVANPVILLDGERIAAVGSDKDVKIPHGVEVVDASHCTLIPGMMDLHIHLCMFNNRTFKNYRVAQWEVTPHLQQMYAYFHAQLCFEMGFTTLRDLGQQSTRGLMT